MTRSRTLLRAADRAEAQLRDSGRSPTAGRQAIAQFAASQADRRQNARDRASQRTNRAVATAIVAGLLALVAAVALVVLLVGGLRRPLSGLIGATRRLAAGDLETRVDPDGPAELRELSAAFNAMAVDLDVSRARVEAGRRRLAATIESLGDALVICDGYGRVLEVNPRAEVLLPMVHVGDSIATEPRPAPAAGRGARRARSTSRTPPGARWPSPRRAWAPRLEDGVVFTVRDTTERARLERAKSEFVATASHELRSAADVDQGLRRAARPDRPQRRASASSPTSSCCPPTGSSTSSTTCSTSRASRPASSRSSGGRSPWPRRSARWRR